MSEAIVERCFQVNFRTPFQNEFTLEITIVRGIVKSLDELKYPLQGTK